MRKAIAVALALGLLGGALIAPAEAGKKKRKPKKVEREAQGTYAAPATVVGNCTQTDGIGCIGILSGPGEKYITATVTDTHGQPVAVTVDGQTDEDINTDVTYGSFCGETAEPIKIDPGVQLVFWIGRADDAAAQACAPGIGTQGTLDVVFSNLP